MATFPAKFWLLKLLFVCGFLMDGNQTAAAKDLLVFAAASLSNPLKQIAETYAKTAKHRIRLSFASSSTLARQISKGAPADIYISANEKWMDFLAESIPEIAASRREVISNRLVMIAPKGSLQPVKSLDGKRLDQILGNGRLAIGDPDHVPAGIYAVEALQALKLWQVAKSKLARLNNVRAALALVERGATPAGIVYQSDAFKNKNVEVLYKFPASSHRRISYWAARVNKRHDHDVEYFFKTLFTQLAKDVFKRHGFLVN
jgi:molybdate transport system substrate-binding protein